MKKFKIIILPIVFFFIWGCATSEKRSVEELKKISLGMSKKEVMTSLGEPTVARGAIRNRYSQIVEVWEYTLTLPTEESTGTIIGKTVITVITVGMGARLFEGERKNYWLYFYEDTLVEWKEVGDWGKEIDRIYKYKFYKKLD